MRDPYEPLPIMVYDVYLVRGKDKLFSRRYLTEGKANRRCVQLDDLWSKIGYKAVIKPVELDEDGPEI